MKLEAFAVRDEKAVGFAHPFFVMARGQAVRMFGDWCQDKNTPLGKHPEDYRLYHVGSFDDESGQFVNQPIPEAVSHGSDWSGIAGVVERAGLREVVK